MMGIGALETEGSSRSACSKSGDAKSRARYFIVAAFSARTLPFPVHSMRVRCIARDGVSEIHIRATRIESWECRAAPEKSLPRHPVDLAGVVVKGRLSRLGTWALPLIRRLP
jgi:hypothetical protein